MITCKENAWITVYVDGVVNDVLEWVNIFPRAIPCGDPQCRWRTWEWTAGLGPHPTSVLLLGKKTWIILQNWLLQNLKTASINILSVGISIHFLKKFIYLFWPVLGFHCCTGFSLVAKSGGCSLVVMHRSLIAVASFIEEKWSGYCISFLPSPKGKIHFSYLYDGR